MRRRWSALRRLPAPERLVLMQALVLLPAMTVALRYFGFRRCHAWLLAWTPDEPFVARDDAPFQIRAMARMVRHAATRGVSNPTCLPHSMVLWFLLRRRRFDARLRVGVRKERADLQAHAWVECDGLVVNDRRNIHTRFVPFEAFGVPEGTV